MDPFDPFRYLGLALVIYIVIVIVGICIGFILGW